MKAVIWTSYGPPEVLKVRDIARPEPKEHDVVVKVAVSNVFPGDCELRRLDMDFPWSLLVRTFCGLRAPKPDAILGQEYAGEVVAVGSAVKRFKIGDRVFGATERLTRGSYAEYVVTSGKTVVTLPENVSFDEAAVATVGGLNALDFLAIAGIAEGGPVKRLLIVGAGGSIGTMAVQIAKAFGAHVTVVDTTHKLKRLLDLGADRAVDFTAEDFTRDGELYDVVIDIVGRNVTGRNSLLRTLKAVKRGGTLVLGNPPFSHVLLRLVAGPFTGKKVRFALARYRIGELRRLKGLLRSGQVRPVIDRRFALDDVVAAHRYVETGQRVGNVVLVISGSGAHAASAV
jgi:2-desacetyl-2-hydroxyethyl bacteriochlorophyllide A dehydrogenase